GCRGSRGSAKPDRRSPARSPGDGQTSPVSRQLIIGSVDPRDPRGRQRNAFRWETLCDDEIGMALAHQPVVSLANGRERRVGLDPEDRIGILRPVGFDADMVCPDAGIIARVEAEMSSDLVQIVILGRAETAVGERYMEQAAEEILEHRAIGCEQTPDLS